MNEETALMDTFLRGTGQSVTISPEQPVVIIGERINPTGRKRLAARLQEGDLSLVREEAQAQVAQGATVIDVNVGAAGVDPVAILPRAVTAVAGAVDVPLAIDTDNAQALEAALAQCPGRPLVNSVTGEESSLQAVLPLVAEYGAAVIGLAMDEQGIPDTAEKRLAVAAKIVERAEALGIDRQDVIVDCLALCVGADYQAGAVTLGAMRRVREELGVNLVLGASNVSFGLPDRPAINDLFLAMAIGQGLTCAITDPAHTRRAILISDLLLGRDEFAMRYISFFRQQQG
jgi:5-methyltetrahydrofolate--homocysteine methyltransferase